MSTKNDETPKKQKSGFDWKPAFYSVGKEVGRSVLLGASWRLGAAIIDRSFALRVGRPSLKVLPGGNQKAM